MKGTLFGRCIYNRKWYRHPLFKLGLLAVSVGFFCYLFNILGMEDKTESTEGNSLHKNENLRFLNWKHRSNNNYLKYVHLLPIEDNMTYPIITREKFKIVIILSYPRSGSSFVSELLNQHPEVYYLYEPLYEFGKTDVHGFPKQIPRSLLSSAIEFLHRVFSCNLNLDDRSYLNEDFVWRMKSLRTFHTNGCKSFNANLVNCLNALCASKSIRVIKTTQVYVQDLTKFLKDYAEKLKMVIVQRDPRAIFFSIQKRFGRSFHYGSQSLCSKMSNDIQIAETTAIHNQLDFYKVVLQEHIVYQPKLLTKKLFSFLEIAAGNNMINAFIERSNFLKHAQKGYLSTWHWRTEVSWEEIISIDKNCKIFYNNSYYNALSDVALLTSLRPLCTYCE